MNQMILATMTGTQYSQSSGGGPSTVDQAELSAVPVTSQPLRGGFQ